MKLFKSILAYVLAVIALFLSAPVAFLAIREVLYRSIGQQTAMSKYYNLTDKQAIIYNSFDGLYEIIVVVILVRWLYKKKYAHVIVVSILVVIIFFVMAHVEEAWRK